MAKRVLIVDDEEQIGEVLGAYLRLEGFEPTVRTTLADALAELAHGPPDLMLLDITLPDGSGLDILRATAGTRIPTIMLTARAEELDRIVGLELGADDYITKPFSTREVVARVRAVMRRTNGDKQIKSREIIRIGELEIDVEEHEVRVREEIVRLTPSEFTLLEILARNPGQVFTRSQLLDALKDDGSVFERTLDRHINNLRKKIEANVEQPEYVQTVYGVGYKMRKT
ncbi:MAG: response regulator transcription factor [Candidatus Baltobacteraceae bacterium]